MCNACGFFCCAHDGFGGCGCDCDEPECWTCINCQRDGHQADVCQEPTEDDQCPACGGQATRCKCTPAEVKKAVDEENAYWESLVVKPEQYVERPTRDPLPCDEQEVKHD